jgi:AcrR family transcriptional regulator
LHPPVVVWQNTVLISKNAIPVEAEAVDDIADRISRESLARRGVDYAGEVRRLLDAGLDVMKRCGTESRPRVADIVAAAGLSNDAFYRHFPSKDALVTAILDDGTERLSAYLDHQMAKAEDPEGKVRRWVEGILAQADEEIAATTLAVLWNGGTAGGGMTAGRHYANALATLLHAPFAELGSDDPELAASLVAHAAVGNLADHLWQGRPPSADDVDRITRFCLAAATAGS